MPSRSLVLLRWALLNFAGGTTLGALLLVQKAYVLYPGLWSLRPLHVELLLFGFMVQFAFGVATWILPRRGIRPSTRIPILAAMLLNAGVWLVGLGSGVFQVGWMELAGRLAEVGGVLLFARGMWPRLDSVRQAARA